MNFTREPIIETIISPKDGFKILVRSSKAGNNEEYFVDAVEVVSFGRAFFFRSLERPKAFLVPASDYEVLEVKETRVALKNVSHERSIKIGGGREAPVRHRDREREREREPQVAKQDEETSTAEESAPAEGEPAEVSQAEPRMDRRRDRRRHRRRRQSDDQEWADRNKGQEQQPREAESPKSDVVSEGGGAQDEVKTSSSMFSSLFPPPPTLISQTLSRYKDKEAAEGTPSVQPQEEARQEEPPVVKKKDKEEDTGSESAPLHRVHAPEELETFSTTHFSPLQGGDGFNQFF